MPLDARQRLDTVEKRFGLVPFLAEHIDHQLRHGGLVLDHQDFPAARRGRHAGAGQRVVGGLVRNPLLAERGQLDHKIGAAPRPGLHGHLAAMFLHDAVDDRETQSGAYAHRLGGEEGIENARGNLRRNPRAIIAHLEGHPPRGDASRAHSDPAAAAALLDGLLGVHQQIEHHLLQLVGIRQGERKFPVQFQHYGYILYLELVTAQGQGALDNFVQVHRLALRFFPAGKQQQIFDDSSGALGLFKNAPGFLGRLGVERAAEQQLRIAHDPGERVVELMGDSGNQLAERGHFFGLHQFRLNHPFSGNVAIELQPADPLAVGAQYRPAMPLQHQPARQQDFQLIPCSFRAAGNNFTPAPFRQPRVAEALAHFPQQLFEVGKLREPERIDTQQMSKPRVGKPQAALRVEYHDSAFHRIQDRGQLGVYFLALHAQGLVTEGSRGQRGQRLEVLTHGGRRLVGAQAHNQHAAHFAASFERQNQDLGDPMPAE